MSERDLYELVKEVQAAGGPLGIAEREQHTDVLIDLGDEGGMSQYLDDCLRPSVQGWLVGVLKRDLIARKCGPVASTVGTTRTRVWLTTPHNHYIEERGDPELEALLKTWIGAAKAEGWQS